jgi:AcrR family transcriptional regulator
VFGYFTSKTGLFLAAYQAAARWLMDRCQDAIVTEELAPGLFGSAAQSPRMRDVRVQQFVELLCSTIGAGPGPA